MRKRQKTAKNVQFVESLWRVDKILSIHLTQITDVGNTGFEPVTSCLSSKRSKPTELIAHKRKKPLLRLGGR